MLIKNLKFKEVNLPVIKETYNKDYVYFGDNNLFPQETEAMVLKSTKQSYMLRRIRDMIIGGGIIEDGKSNAFLQFINNENGNETLNDILPKIAKDLATFGAFSIKCVWSNNMQSVKKIVYFPVKKVRYEKMINDDDFEYFYYSNNWQKSRRKENEPQRIAGFNQKNIKYKEQLMYVKMDTSLDYYGLPHWVSALNYVQLDWEISNFHLSNCLNSYNPSMIISYNNGVPTLEEQDILVKGMDENFIGSDNAGSAMISFAIDKEHAMSIDKVELNTSDERFVLLEAQIQQNLLSVNQCTNPLLMGISVPGSLGGREEVLESFELYQLTFISQFQKVIEKAFNKILNINSITDTYEIEEYKIFKEIENQTKEDKE